jgi:replicative DNA helicase
MPAPFNGNGNGKSRSETGPPTDRLPPQNLEAEQGVIGAIVLDNEVLHDVIPLLRVDDFYRDTHQIIYRAIRDLYDLGKPIDLVILSEELGRRGELEAIGGDETLVEIVNNVPSAANARYHADIVRDKAVVRNLIEAGNEILREGYANNLTAEDQVQAAEQQIFNIAEDQTSGQTVDLREVITTAMERIVARTETKHPITGVATGYFELDDLTGGFQPEQLVILAARPSMGKTALALNICGHVAIKNQKGVLLVSLEMSKLELAERLLCAHSKVDGHKIRTGHNLVARDMQQLGQGYEDLLKAPLWIDDTPARNMLQITANARRLKMRQDIGLVVVDYIQLIDSESSDGRDSRQEQIARISRRLKTLARELHVPVIALSQLNRAVENREDRRPRMADLRESGAIEQDADLVLLLHRPEYYDANDQPGIAELNIAKNRNGATQTIKLTFLKNFTKFENYSANPDVIDAGSF